MDPKPKVIVELGSYVGYTAVALGGMLKDLHPQEVAMKSEKLYSMELDPRWGAITSSFVELAGLKGIVDVVIGPAESSLRRLVAEGILKKGTVDVLLLDHWEKEYVSALKVCEELGLLRKGSIIFADNVITPGAPDYLEYVRGANTGLKYESKEIKTILLNGWKVRP